jgi:hypothetical protein
VLTAAVLGTATTAIVSGAAGGLSQRDASASGPADIYVDELFRAAPVAAQGGGAATNGDTAGVVTPRASQGGADPAVRAEASRIFLKSLRDHTDIVPADRSYLAQLVAARTGLSQADAEKRVSDVIVQAKQDLDKARSAAAKLSLWLTAALLAGAFSASLAAIEGGQLRDRRTYP